MPPSFGDLRAHVLGSLEADRLSAVVHAFSVARSAVALLHTRNFLSRPNFARHGIGHSLFFSGAPAITAPTRPTCVTEEMQQSSCAFCEDALLDRRDIWWDDDEEAWVCSSALIVPFEGSYAHTKCLPRLPHV